MKRYEIVVTEEVTWCMVVEALSEEKAREIAYLDYDSIGVDSTIVNIDSIKEIGIDQEPS